MDQYKEGCLVCSRAGHDKGKLYIIMAVNGEYVFLVDGKTRTIHNPKKKKKKHICYVSDSLFKEDESFEDDKIKHAIKQARRKLQSK